MKRVLFICRSNNGRSIMAEAITSAIAPGQFRGYSAGLEPGSDIPGFILEFIKSRGLPTARLKSKSYEHFTGLRATKFDYVITTCDKKVFEACPVWPGQPTCAHWNIAVPEFRPGDDAFNRQLLEKLYDRLHATISMFVALPDEVRSRMEVDDDISRLYQEQIALAC
ncbi:MAG: arsenate reductase ArsC [Alphaproteobacteria bacterium]|nr:arsenate reductase ArsC [Alphaproteobacteria bacterium]